MNYIEELISKAAKENKVISICIKKIDWDKRHIGFVKKQERTKFIMTELNAYGKVIGLRDILFADIRAAEFGGIYNDNLEKVYYSNVWKKKNATRYINNINLSSARKLLNSLMSMKVVCTFYANDFYTIGMLQDISEDLILIRNITFQGCDDGLTSYYIKSLTRIRYNGPIELKAALLYSPLASANL